MKKGIDDAGGEAVGRPDVEPRRSATPTARSGPPNFSRAEIRRLPRLELLPVVDEPDQPEPDGGQQHAPRRSGCRRFGQSSVDDERSRAGSRGRPWWACPALALVPLRACPRGSSLARAASARSRVISHGPRRNEITSAVTVAIAVRNVMYRNTLKTMWYLRERHEQLVEHQPLLSSEARHERVDDALHAHAPRALDEHRVAGRQPLEQQRHRVLERGRRDGSRRARPGAPPPPRLRAQRPIADETRPRRDAATAAPMSRCAASLISPSSSMSPSTTTRRRASGRRARAVASAARTEPGWRCRCRRGCAAARARRQHAAALGRARRPRGPRATCSRRDARARGRRRPRRAR